MSSVNVNALKSVIDLATSDCKFVEMLDLFKCHVPDLEAVDFFQPNSRLRDLEPALLTNFHMYSVLYFHYLRYGTKFGKSFIGRITNTKKSDPGLYFSRDHVLSLCSLILKQKITNVNMLKIWQTLDGKFKSCKTNESSKFIGDPRGKTKWLVAHPKQRAKRAGCHCGRGLGAQPPVGSRGEAPGGGLGGRSPPGSTGLGAQPPAGSRGGAPGGGLGGRSPPENF